MPISYASENRLCDAATGKDYCGICGSEMTNIDNVADVVTNAHGRRRKTDRLRAETAKVSVFGSLGEY
ncbi:hypothetical protein GBP346_B2693 [Burkholderia pseudomallei MSHR346]|nr:hypothetical protein GBP346_B2693 [Burkholderia pseudomallei MSHR346]